MAKNRATRRGRSNKLESSFLERLGKLVEEHFREHQESPPPTPSSFEQDLRSFRAYLSTRFIKEFILLASVSEELTPRAYVFENPTPVFDDEPDGSGWVACQVQVAHPRFMPKGTDSLDEKLEDMLTQANKARHPFALWLCPIHPGASDAALHVKHFTGESVTYIKTDLGFAQLPKTSQLAGSLHKLFGHYGSLVSSIDTLYGAFSRELETSFRAAADAPELSKHAAIFLSSDSTKQMLSNLAEAASGPLVEENTRLATIACHFAAKAEDLQAAASTFAVNEFEIAKDSAVKRLKTELSKAHLVANGAVLRSNKLQAELREIKRSHLAVTAPGTADNQDLVGLALARLFEPY